MRLVIVVLTLVLLNSCAQLTRLDTARTIGEGNTEIGAQVTGYGVNQEASPDLGAAVIPFVEVNVNHGITDNLDLNVSTNTSLNMYANVKYQIYGDQESAVAISILPGADVQFGSFDSGDQSIYFRPHLSGIISLHQNEWALFAEPKYIYQYWTENHFVGATFGIDYSLPRTSFAFGYSLFPVLGENISSGSNIYQLGFSARLKIGKKNKN